jgi:acylpyruvate hydrolase
MKLVTIRTTDGTRAGRIEGTEVVLLPYSDVGALLAADDWDAQAMGDGDRVALAGADLGPLVPNPSKVFCVGLNYLLHVKEGGRGEVPNHPTLFAKFADSLTGPNDPIPLPKASPKVDWEVELVAVVGKTVRNANEQEAIDAIAGYTVGNDTSMRDWQRRTEQWLQGKCWGASSPVGPALVTLDELGSARPDLRISCEVNGTIMQDSRTSDLLFDAVHVVQYASTIIPLRPGDLIFTGTPDGVGAARNPPIFLQHGDTVTCRIEGLGELVNRCVSEDSLA